MGDIMSKPAADRKLQLTIKLKRRWTYRPVFIGARAFLWCAGPFVNDPESLAVRIADVIRPLLFKIVVD